MPKFLISWTKSGVAEVEADNHDDALNEFATWGDDEVLATMDTDDWHVETPKEREASQRRMHIGEGAAETGGTHG